MNETPFTQNIGQALNESVNAQGDKSKSEQIAVQRVVMPAELQNLPDLRGVLNIAGPLPAGWVTVPVSTRARVAEPFQIIQQ